MPKKFKNTSNMGGKRKGAGRKPMYNGESLVYIRIGLPKLVKSELFRRFEKPTAHVRKWITQKLTKSI